MSGTGPTPAEQHLGDRLAALVDGELGHDARERVLAHLATCPKCKAEADAQRRLKNVFAQAAPPPPSEGFLARLQGLPGGPGDFGGDDDGRGGPFGPGRFADGVFGVRTDGFGYVPAGGGHAAVLPADPGFRIHPVARPGQERPSWRGRRFAFAAASAVSLAAIALGGALPLEAAVDPSSSTASGEGAGTDAVRLSVPRGPQTRGQAPAGPDQTDRSDRRRGGARGFRDGLTADEVPLGTQGGGTTLLPLSGVPTQPFSTPGSPLAGGSSLGGGSSLPPLIRPGQALRLALVPGATPSATPAPTRLDGPAEPVLPLASRR
ncbi:zf-HC2 domain-containing protein [Streptomyces sp. NPDC001941]|uniref:anti-sigma factor family protein n=1 Tax=Streptomyces sp. NPDC001941 TaxID=3154659 RepID=UPI003332FE1E